MLFFRWPFQLPVFILPHLKISAAQQITELFHMLCRGDDGGKSIWITELGAFPFAEIVVGEKVYLGAGGDAAGQIAQGENVICGIIGAGDNRSADPDVTIWKMFRNSAQV